MPHQRERYLEHNIKKCMKFSPLVGVLGHRQVGKTTLLEKLSSSYYTLDIKTENQEATNTPSEYLKKRAGAWVALDECQTVPDLFPELKEWVRTNKTPGQFLLSGSVRFTSREAIRESLTGRIVNLELLPFSLSELNHQPLPTFCPEALEANTLEFLLHRPLKDNSSLRKDHQLMEVYYECGGLPGICFIRDETMRRQKVIEQLTTILDRDLRMVRKIQLPFTDLRAIVESLALLQGFPLDYTRIKKETGISTPTIKKVIYALEAVFLIRNISIEGSSKGSCIFFEDQAEQSILSPRVSDPAEKLLHFCFTNLRTQFAYQLGQYTEIFQYRTRGGAVVPLAFKNKKGCLGIIPVSGSDRVTSVLGSVNSFLKTYANAKVLIVYPTQEKPYLVQPRVLALPMGQLV